MSIQAETKRLFSSIFGYEPDVAETTTTAEPQAEMPQPQTKEQLFANIFGYEPDIAQPAQFAIERPTISPVTEERFLPKAEAAPAATLTVPTDPLSQEKQEYMEAMRAPAKELRKEAIPEAPQETPFAQPSSTYIPTDPLLAEKHEVMAQRETPVEAGAKEALLAATFSESPVSEARRREHPVASTIGTVAGSLLPVIGGGMGITKTAMSIPTFAKIAASGPAGKAVTSAITRMVTGALNNFARNNEALFSHNPEIQDRARKDMAIDMAALALSPVPEVFLPGGLIQPFAQAATDAAIMATGQLVTGLNPLDKKNFVNTLVSSIASGVFGLGDIKGMKGSQRQIVNNLKKISKAKEWTIDPDVSKAIDKGIEQSLERGRTPSRAPIIEETRPPQFGPIAKEEIVEVPEPSKEVEVVRHIKEPYEKSIARLEEEGYTIKHRGLHEEPSIEGAPIRAAAGRESRPAVMPGDEGPGRAGAEEGAIEGRTTLEIDAEKKRELAETYKVDPEVIDRIDELIREDLYRTQTPQRAKVFEEGEYTQFEPIAKEKITKVPEPSPEVEVSRHVTRPYAEEEVPFPSAVGDELGTRLAKVSPEEIDAAAKAAEAKPEFEGLPRRGIGILSQVGAVGGKKQMRLPETPAAEKTPAQNAQIKFDKQHEEVRKKFVPSIKQRIRNITDFFGAGLIDREYYAKRLLSATPEGDQAIGQLNASRGYSAESKTQYDDAEKHIAEYLPHDTEELFANYLQAKRTLEIETAKGEGTVQHTGGMTMDEAQDFVNQIETALPSKNSKAIKLSAQRYWDAMNNQLAQLKDEGLITEDEFKVLSEQGKNYSPRRFIQHIDPDRVSVNNRGRRVSVSDSGLERIDTGSEEAMINNWRLLLAETTSRTQARIFKNRASKELYNFAKAHPENDIDVREEIPIQRKVALDDARSIAEDLQGAKLRLEQRLRNPISAEQRLRLEEKMRDLEDKIDDLTTDKDISEVDTDIEITELQKRALDLNNELTRSETTREYNFYRNKIAAINTKIERLSQYPKSKEIDAQINKLKTSRQALTERIETPLTGTQISTIENKIQSLSDKIDRWGTLIGDAEGQGLDEITFNSKQYGKIPAGYERISTVIDGEKKSVLAPTRFAASWNSSDQAMSRTLAKGLNYASGSFILRPLATGALAPEFAFSNIPRDAAMQWLVTKEYNPVAPVALFQIGRNFARVAKDAWTGEGRYRDYVKQGGGMEFLYEQGAMFRDPTRPVTATTERGRQIKQAMTKLQEFSERLGRLALREQAILNGKSAEEATRIAREYLDFAQGGSWTKAIDNAVPYLNASVQGTRSLVRALRTDKATTSAKAFQLMAMGAGLAYTSYWLNSDTAEKISDREKVTRWNFPLPFKTAEGNQTYFSIPKDQSARLFATIGEVSAERHMGKISGETAWRKIKMAFSDLNPVDIIGMVPPTMSAVIGYSLNRDFWTKDAIWKGREKVHPHKEFYPGHTPKALTDMASQLSKIGVEVSPARLESALGQVMPKNPVTALMGGMYEQIANGLPDKERNQLDKKVIDHLTKTVITRKFLRKTYPERIDIDVLVAGMKKYGISRFDKKGRKKTNRMLQEELDEMEMKVSDIRQMNDNEAKIISELFIAGSRGEAAKKWGELKKSAGKALGSKEIERLNRRLKKAIKKKL